MKILIIVDSINIEDSSGSKANVALIKNLHLAGFEVLVYHYTLKNIDLKDIPTIAISEIKYHPYYFLSRLQRVLVRHFNIVLAPFLENKFGFSFTFFNDVLSIKKALKSIDFQFDIAITLSKGASFRPHYALLQIPEFHHKWLAYIHDPYPHFCYPEPYKWNDYGYKHKIIFFQKMAKAAKNTAFPSQMLMEWMGDKFPKMLLNGIVIPHQNSDFAPQTKKTPDFFNISKFNILHAGNLLEQRSPSGLIDGFLLFLTNNPTAESQVQLTLIGHTDPVFEKLVVASKYRIAILFLNKNIDFETVFAIQKATSINVILEAKARISPFLPAKFVHCVAANKKILLLAPFRSETKRLLGNNYEFWSEADDVKLIANLIEKAYYLWSKNRSNMELNRPDLEFYLSADHLKNCILSLSYL